MDKVCNICNRFLMVSILVGISCGFAFTQGKESLDISSRVKVERIPAANIIYLEVKGNYDKHQEAFPQLVDYALANYRIAGACFGIYPIDPDAVGEKFAKVQQTGGKDQRSVQRNPSIKDHESKLIWFVALRIAPGAPSLKHEKRSEDPFAVDATESELKAPQNKLHRAKAPFQIKQLPEITALVMESTVKTSPVDGMAMFKWMLDNGYVQVGATRMEIGLGTERLGDTVTKIIIPVKKRMSGLN
jgi:hypothetical protein